MADYKKHIYALRECAKEHENERAFTGQIIVSDLCRDTANLLETLEQEPCDDCVSRQAALDAVRKNTFRLTFAEEQGCEGHIAWSAEAVYSDVIEGALLKLPSVAPKTRWIPVSERLPEENGNYLVTVEANDGTAKIKYQMVDHYGPKWLHDEKTRKVIAWMPLPEPYREREEKRR